MTYYLLNDEQRAYLREVVRGKTVADLGCGDGSLALDLRYWGATHVHAVDKVPCRVSNPDVTVHRAYFDKWVMPKGVQMATLFWPQNNSLPGLVNILDRVHGVIYVGANTEGSSCGNPDLFKYLTGLETVRYLPDRRNVLIHYRLGPRKDPTMFHEEWSALVMKDSGWHRYNPSTDRKMKDEWRDL